MRAADEHEAEVWQVEGSLGAARRCYKVLGRGLTHDVLLCDSTDRQRGRRTALHRQNIPEKCGFDAMRSEPKLAELREM